MDAIDLGFYRHQGHVTVNDVFAAAEMDAVVRDIEQWGEAFLADLPAGQRAWYLDGGVKARTTASISAAANTPLTVRWPWCR